MFKDEESFSGGEGYHPYIIYICDGGKKPATLGEIKERSMGQTTWDQENFDVAIEITRTGIATWLVLYDGVSIIARPLSFPGIMVTGSQSIAHIKKKD